MLNPGKEGINAAKEEAAERRVFGDQYDNFQDLLGDFEQQVDELVELFRTRALSDYAVPKQTHRIKYQITRILLDKASKLGLEL